MKDILTGRDDKNIIRSSHFDQDIHRGIENSLLKLQQRAKVEGIDLQVISGFRNYDRQLATWVAKAEGKKDLLDINGIPMDFSKMSQEEVLYSILRWSAIPGASRHHWGTDVDLYDKNTLPQNYTIELTPQEVAPDGIFGKLHLWLDKLIEENDAEGFFRPYVNDQGGVSPEKWHLSYAPISSDYRQRYTLDFFRENIERSTMPLKELLLDRLEELYENYVQNITEPADQ